jgi:hypothetical protein
MGACDGKRPELDRTGNVFVDDLVTWIKSVSMTSPNNKYEPEHRPVLSTRAARQGVTGHNVRYVLGFSLAALVIAFGIIWLIYFA